MKNPGVKFIFPGIQLVFRGFFFSFPGKFTLFGGTKSYGAVKNDALSEFVAKKWFDKELRFNFQKN